MRVKDDPLTSQADLARKTAESIRVEAEAAYAAVRCPWVVAYYRCMVA